MAIVRDSHYWRERKATQRARQREAAEKTDNGIPLEEKPGLSGAIPEIKIDGVEADPVSALSVDIPSDQSDPIVKYAQEVAAADEAAAALKKQIAALRHSQEIQRQQAAQQAAQMASQQPMSREEKLQPS